MARVNITNLAIAGGIGVVDELVEGLDQKQSRTKPYRNVTDWYRLLLLGGGVVSVMTDTMADKGEIAMYIGATLTVKSLGNAFRKGLTAQRSQGAVGGSQNGVADLRARAMAALQARGSALPAGGGIAQRGSEQLRPLVVGY